MPAVPKDRRSTSSTCALRTIRRGTVATKAQLKGWVDYALANDAVIFFDAAYEAYITEPGYPHSIYEIEGAAVRHRVPQLLQDRRLHRGALRVHGGPEGVTAKTPAGERVALNQLWNRRHTTKFNGVSYPVQRAAAAVYSDKGWRQTKAIVDYYLGNAKIIREGLAGAGLTVYGGVNAPYVWLKTPGGVSSWDFFDRLLTECNVVGTPGSGFGPSGEGFFRLSAFGNRNNVMEAVERIRKNLR